MTGATAFQSAAVGGQTTQFQRQKFLSLYPRRDAFIWKTYSGERWKTEKGPLLDCLIMGVVSDTGRGLFRGCFSSHKTKFAVLDIDTESKYRNVAELQKLQAHLSAVELYAITYQSSDSGGWHLYLPFDDWEESDEVETTLKTWLKCLGYKIVGGQLEVFPSGNGLRLPLQKGFAWLAPDGSLKVRREELREDEALASFLQDFEENVRNWDVAERLIESQIKSAGMVAGAGVQEHEKVISLAGLEDLFKRGKIEEVWKNGRDYWLHGLTCKNQRHDAVMAVGHYLWYGEPSENVPAYPGRRNDETRARLIEAWLKKKHNGFCNHINRNDWKEIEAHIWRTVFWRRGKNYQARKPYPMTDRVIKRLIEVYNKTGQLFEIDRMAEANKARLEDARSRIKKAVQELVEEGVVLTKSEVARRAGCNRRTVVKHSDLLTFWPSVYNRGVWGVSLGSVVPELGFEKKEKSENPLCTNSDSGDLENEPATWGLGINGTEKCHKPNAGKVAPLQFCPANSQPESTQHQDRALRVAAQVLTPGPLLSGIPSEWQVCAGGTSFISQTEDSTASGACYTVDTAGGIKEQAGAAFEMGTLVPFGAKNKNEKTIPDATNCRFLTTIKPGYSSGLADEFSLISNIAASPLRWEARYRRPLETNLSRGLSARITGLCLGSWRFADDSPGSQKPSSLSAVPQKPSSARLSVNRRGLCPRGPPKCKAHE